MYQTGTFSSVAGLKSTIESFCTTNGWTLTSGVLHKGLSYIKLTTPDAYRLTIQGANSVDFLTTPCPFSQTLYLLAEELPATYYLFVHANPDMCVCVVNYSTVKIQVLMFGDIVKVSNSAYTGGNFFFASRLAESPNCTYVNCLKYIDDADICVAGPITTGPAYSSFMPFVTSGRWGDRLYDNVRTGFHAEIDDYIWDSDGAPQGLTTIKIMLTESSISSYYRSPNQWDSQAHLIPMHIQARMEDNLWGYLGYVEHIRLIRIDNYNIGDIVEIAPDSWKVFPWIKKEMTYPNGGENIIPIDTMLLLEGSGSLGFAVRYDV